MYNKFDLFVENVIDSFKDERKIKPAKQVYEDIVHKLHIGDNLTDEDMQDFFYDESNETLRPQMAIFAVPLYFEVLKYGKNDGYKLFKRYLPKFIEVISTSRPQSEKFIISLVRYAQNNPNKASVPMVPDEIISTVIKNSPNSKIQSLLNFAQDVLSNKTIERLETMKKVKLSQSEDVDSISGSKNKRNTDHIQALKDLQSNKSKKYGWGDRLYTKLTGRKPEDLMNFKKKRRF